MQASPETLSAMLCMQQLDLELLQAKKKFEALPQRAQILEVRKKKAQIEQKRAEVAKLKEACERKVSQLTDEDGQLAKKAAEVQEAIDGAKGDYRNVESRTKELNGIAKRRGALEGEFEAAEAQLEKVQAVESQVAAALEQLDKQEAAAVASFQEEGGALQSDIARLGAQRNQLGELLPPDMAELYTKTAARCGGVAIGQLRDGRCSTCRSAIDPSRLTEVRAQAPLSTCPACKRLLVVGK